MNVHSKPQFPCTKCGICCNLVGAVEQLGVLREEFKKANLKSKSDGRCIHLTYDNMCSIYDKRPEICRVKSNFKEVANRCNQMQMAYGVPKKYRVRLPVV